MSEAGLVERLLHPKYNNPQPNDEGWVLDAVSVRRDMTEAANIIATLSLELATLKKLPTAFGGGVAVSGCGGAGGGGYGSSNFPGKTATGVQPPSEGDINYVVLVSCKDNSSYKNNGAALTWLEVYKEIGDQLEKWIDDGLNIRGVVISATRDPVYQKRSTTS